MESILIYLGKSAIASGAFYLAYLVLFQNQKQFTFNRVYLLVSLTVSFFLPLITFTRTETIEMPPVTPVFYGVSDAAPTVAYVPETTVGWEWQQYLMIFYFLGVAGFLFYLLAGHFKAFAIIKQSISKMLFDARVKVSKRDIHPFSFFKNIVISNETLSHPNLHLIVEHEKIHVTENHTIDILISEILFLLQWFNPFAWLIKDAIKNNLEFKTDHQLMQKFDPKTYQLVMVSLAGKTGVAPFLTALNGSQLKNRIVMMKKKTENKYTFVKQLVILPLVAVLVMGLANREVKTKYIQTEQSEFLTKKTVNGKVSNEKGEPISGASIIIKDRNFGIVSDNQGNYEIEVKKDDKILVFSYLDIDKKEIDINNNSNIDVQLHTNKKPESKNYDYRKGNLFDGTLQMINSNGEWGKPLYIVDGKEVDGFKDFDWKNQSSVSVLKENAATKYYGSKGKHGAVQIATNNWKFPMGSNPLIILDGKEFRGNIEDISKEGIFQVIELRYPNFTEEYGEKGKDGVILITTNKMKPVSHLIHDENRQMEDSYNFENKTNLNSLSELSSKNNANQTKIQKEPDANKKETKIKGKITNENGEPLIGVNVIIKGTTIGTISDLKGEFSIQLKPKHKYLLFSMVGYETQELETGEKTHLDVILKELGYKTDEVVVTGYGSNKKQTSGFQISSAFKGNGKPIYIVDGIEMKEVTDLNPDNIESISVLKDGSAIKLYGERAKDGAIIIQTKSGQFRLEPGNPLYVVDGKEFTGNIKSISPNDIETITVLKDKSATILYGDKGKDGVILITTKKASENTTPLTNNEQDVEKQVFFIVEEMPEFPGGEMELRKFIATNIKFPKIAMENGIQGKVYVTFVISKTGKVTDAKISRGVDPSLDKEALRVVNTLPEWKPGKQRGKEVNVSYTVPITFALQDKSSSLKNLPENVLYIVDGKEFAGDINSISPEEIQSVSVKKPPFEWNSPYSKNPKAQNGVILIQTKTKYNSSTTEKPLIFVNGVQTNKDMKELDPNTIASVNVLKDKNATEKYGEKAKNGVIEITLKDPNIKITSELELRRLIAEKIKYPVAAQEKNQVGIVKLWVNINSNGRISNFLREKPSDVVQVDEVVVVAYKSKTNLNPESRTDENPLLRNEVTRVLNLIPEINIPAFKGKTIEITVNFVLQ